MLMCDNKYTFYCRKIKIISVLSKICALFTQFSGRALPEEGDGVLQFQAHISRSLSAADQVL